MNNSESIFIKCNCGGCSVLEVNYDDFDKDIGQFNFAMWVTHPCELPMSKKERIRWCEGIMKTGNPWADHTIVTRKDAQRLVEFLTKKLAKYGKKSQNGKK
jgi:hypothetical protein